MRRLLKRDRLRFKTACLVVMLVVAVGNTWPAAAASGNAAGGAHSVAIIFFWIALIILLARIASLVERLGQPAVLGELLMGVVLGNLGLLGLAWFEPIKSNEILRFLAELGVVVLLFQVGLETNITEMRQVGLQAAAVAVIGVVAPFVLGTFVAGPWLLPGLSANAYLFLGATLTATSVGITARVFRDLGQLHSADAKIVLGAAVIDDVLGLIVLAVVSALAVTGAVQAWDVTWIIIKAALFLGGAIFLGQLLGHKLGVLFAKINTQVGMKFALAFGLALILAYLAELLGLAPIIGAFTAGLILDPVYFYGFDYPHIVPELKEAVQGASQETQHKVTQVLDRHAERHMEELVEPIGFMLAPLFFVLTGMNVNLADLFNPAILLVALAITVVAIVGKVVAGWAAGPGRRKALIGWGMAPRGEVGLIFATTGQRLEVISNEVFSIIVIMVILTTLLTPPILTFLLKR